MMTGVTVGGKACSPLASAYYAGTLTQELNKLAFVMFPFSKIMETFLFFELLLSNSLLICQISVEEPHGDILIWQSTETYYLQLPRNLFVFSQAIVGHLCMSYYNLEIYSVFVTVSKMTVLGHLMSFWYLNYIWYLQGFNLRTHIS